MTTRLGTILLCALALAQLPGQTMGDLNAQACDVAEGNEKTLNQVYGQILKAHAGDEDFVRSFKTAQEAWGDFRRANIKSVYPSPNPMVEYGTTHAACVCYLSAEMARERTAELRKRWITGVEEGDVCVGSCASHPPVKQRLTKKKGQA